MVKKTLLIVNSEITTNHDKQIAQKEKKYCSVSCRNHHNIINHSKLEKSQKIFKVTVCTRVPKKIMSSPNGLQ